MEDLLMKYKEYFVERGIFNYKTLDQILDNSSIKTSSKMIDLDEAAQKLYNSKGMKVPKTCDGMEIYKNGILLVEAKGFTNFIIHQLDTSNMKKSIDEIQKIVKEKIEDITKKVRDSVLLMNHSTCCADCKGINRIRYENYKIPKMVIFFVDIDDNIGPISEMLINDETGNLIEIMEKEIEKYRDIKIPEIQPTFKIMYRRNLNNIEDILDEELLNIENSKELIGA